MFKIVEKRRAWWPVTWKGVTEDGKIVTNRIRLRFLLLKVDDFERLMEEVAAIQAASAEARSDEDKQRASEAFASTVERIAEDWQDVGIDDGSREGKPLPWNHGNLVLLMNEPHVFDAVLTAYKLCMAGGERQRQGN